VDNALPYFLVRVIYEEFQHPVLQNHGFY